MGEFESLSKWLKFGIIYGGFALILFLFSCAMQGWNITYTGGASNRGFGHGVATDVQACGVCGFICVFGAMAIFLGMMQTELNKISLYVIIALYMFGGILIIAAIGLYEDQLGYAPVSSSCGCIAGFCSFIAGIFVILDIVGVAG